MLKLVARSFFLLMLLVALVFAGLSFLPESIGGRMRVGVVVYITLFFRYLLIAGLAFAVFYGWKRDNWLHKRIQKRFPDAKLLKQEFRYSLSTFAIFSLIGIGIHEANKHGLTLIYSDIGEYGWWYFGFSIVLALVIHDTYFYWTHRFMHWKPVFKVMHRVHHYSHNPSPWASFSFHPTEAVIEGGILPLLVVIMPMHPLAIAAFLVIMTAMNVLGHLGYELYPSGFTKHWLLGLNNTSTHHNMHHKYTRCNYGLYFNWWDRIMGTNHACYEEHYEQVAGEQKIPVDRTATAHALRTVQSS